MKLCEKFGIAKIQTIGKIAFIVDASESVANYQQEIILIIQNVLSELPAKVERTLYFLGNPSAYSPQNFVSKAVKWFKENRKRVSLIAPIVDSLEFDKSATVVIVGSGPIFDLEDYKDTSVMQHLILVSMNDSLQGEQQFAEELMHPTAQQLLQRLYDPVVLVEILGPAFMPILWDNEGFKLFINKSQPVLRGIRLDDYSLRMQYFIKQEQEAYIQVVSESGKTFIQTLNPSQAIHKFEYRKGQLTEPEVEILRKAVQRNKFPCLYCGEQHSWGTLRCLRKAVILGELVYPSLQKHNGKGFVIFEIESGNVRFKFHPCNVLCLGPGKVAVKENAKASIYTYNEDTNHWILADGRFPAYYPLTEGRYAILI